MVNKEILNIGFYYTFNSKYAFIHFPSKINIFIYVLSSLCESQSAKMTIFGQNSLLWRNDMRNTTRISREWEKGRCFTHLVKRTHFRFS